MMNVIFPTIEASNLEGEKVLLPQDLEGTLNVVIIAFQRQQQLLVDTWIPFLEELTHKTPGLAFYELPTIRSGIPFLRFIVDSGMRAGIPDKQARERTITIYTKKKQFRQKLDIPNEDNIFIFLMKKDGHILWRSEGEFTIQKGIELEKAINENL
jgi:hypothetical protein